jgi:anti-anti-sigma factor
MEITVTSLKGIPLIEALGEIDHNSCAGLEAALGEVLDHGTPVVLLDFGQVTYIDSGGICVLLSGSRRLREHGWLGVIGPNPNVRRILEIVGLAADPSFRMFDDRSAAEAVLPEGDRI